MAIANATTEVSIDKTVGEIMALLRRIGARSVVVRYDAGESPSGVGFEIHTEHGPREFELPVQVEGVRQSLIRDKVSPRFQTQEHAARVAWRVAKDWLRAQVALIEAKIVTPVQVMLPYLVMERATESGKVVTLYDRYLEREEILELTTGEQAG